MTSNNNYFSQERTILIFLLFVLSNVSLFLHYFARLGEVGWQKVLDQFLFYFGIFGHAVVIGIIIFYYLSRANEWLRKDKKRIIVPLAILLGLGYSIFDGLFENSWLIFCRDIFMAALIIIGIPIIEKILSKIFKTKK